MSGSLIKLDEEIITTSTANVTLGAANWDTSYDVYQVIMTDVQLSANTSVNMRMLLSGTAQDTSNYDRAYNVLRTDATTAASNNTEQTSNMINGGTSVGSLTNHSFNCIQFLFSFNESSKSSHYTNEAVFLSEHGSEVLFGVNGGGMYEVSASHNGVFYYPGSGTFESGKFSLFGLKK
jgi:hypothetical protein